MQLFWDFNTEFLENKVKYHYRNGGLAMKNFLSYIIVGLILWFFSLWLVDIYADEKLPDEMIMETQTGEVVLTIKSCSPELKQKGFDYYAYATEPGLLHPGCWNAELDYVLIYFPEIDKTAMYKKNQFHPRPLKPNVNLEPKFEHGDRVMVYGVYNF